MELNINHLSKQFGNKEVIRDINCSLSNGVYGLLGINGAGKTTLMRMICALLQPSSGQITFDGKNIEALGADYRQLIGYLPQEFGFYPYFTVKDYLLYIASLKGIPAKEAVKRAQFLAKEVGVEAFYHQKMKQLSGGTKRRVGMAQALLNNPKILILDEPTAGLDPSERVRFRNLISQLSENRMVLLSTHIVSDVAYIAKEIIILKEGQIKHQGSVEQIIDEMPEQVWLCPVDRSLVNSLVAAYNVVNMKTIEAGVELRIISKTPPFDQARLVDTTLEDVFLYYFGYQGQVEL